MILVYVFFAVLIYKLLKAAGRFRRRRQMQKLIRQFDVAMMQYKMQLLQQKVTNQNERTAEKQHAAAVKAENTKQLATLENKRLYVLRDNYIASAIDIEKQIQEVKQVMIDWKRPSEKQRRQLEKLKKARAAAYRNYHTIQTKIEKNNCKISGNVKSE